mmetsp:Transcript_4911/g.8983  ORF Transcript_4911/g.8983 Transcript_4911/m.8983 type:complete len:163 (+) Transcript_4911:96-584(+)
MHTYYIAIVVYSIRIRTRARNKKLIMLISTLYYLARAAASYPFAQFRGKLYQPCCKVGTRIANRRTRARAGDNANETLEQMAENKAEETQDHEKTEKDATAWALLIAAIPRSVFRVVLVIITSLQICSGFEVLLGSSFHNDNITRGFGFFDFLLGSLLNIHF